MYSLPSRTFAIHSQMHMYSHHHITPKRCALMMVVTYIRDRARVYACMFSRMHTHPILPWLSEHTSLHSLRQYFLSRKPSLNTTTSFRTVSGPALSGRIHVATHLDVHFMTASFSASVCFASAAFVRPTTFFIGATAISIPGILIIPRLVILLFPCC